MLLWHALFGGDVEKFAELIRQDPGFNVNMWLEEYGFTLLHIACWEDKRSAVIPLLLAHPDIDVNVKDENAFRGTPFYFASLNESPSCALEMLKDSRVKVNEPTKDGITPLREVAYNGHLDVIKWWIASGREMDLGKPGDVDKTDAIGVAKKQGKTEVASLLERFKSDAAKTRSEVRLELGITGQSLYSISPLIIIFFFFFKLINLFQLRFPCDHSTKAHAGRVHCLRWWQIL